MDKKETVIKAITEMNIDLLDVVLENNSSYLDVPKEVFIKELSNKFERLNKQGITIFYCQLG